VFAFFSATHLSTGITLHGLKITSSGAIQMASRKDGDRYWDNYSVPLKEIEKIKDSIREYVGKNPDWAKETAPQKNFAEELNGSPIIEKVKKDAIPFQVNDGMVV
jgi:hypothetical protein